MSNEELVRRIQQGETELMGTLWEQVHKFIRVQAGKRLAGMQDHIRTQMEDDLVNEAYFGFVKAVEKYSPERNKTFAGFLLYYLPRYFNRALEYVPDHVSKIEPEPLPILLNYVDEQGNHVGSRLIRPSAYQMNKWKAKVRRRDMMQNIQNAVRLDAPAGEDDFTLMETVLDPDGEQKYLMVEDTDFWRDVRAFLEDGIHARMEGDMKTLFLTMLEHDCTYGEAYKIMGQTDERYRERRRQAYHKGLRMLRAYFMGERDRRKAVGIDEYFSIGLKGTGLGAFRNGGFTSSTEREAIRLVDRDLMLSRVRV